MILDSSALLAVIFRESGFEDLLDRIQAADLVAAGTPTLAETGIVLHARLGEASRGLLERLLDELAVLTRPPCCRVSPSPTWETTSPGRTCPVDPDRPRPVGAARRGVASGPG